MAHIDFDVAELSESISAASESAVMANPDMARSGDRLAIASRSRMTARTTEKSAAWPPGGEASGLGSAVRLVRGGFAVAAAVLRAPRDRPVEVVVAEVPTAGNRVAEGPAFSEAAPARVALRRDVGTAPPADDFAAVDRGLPLAPELLVLVAIALLRRRFCLRAGPRPRPDGHRPDAGMV